jgi:undecaprenyl diphosphate synthase
MRQSTFGGVFPGLHVAMIMAGNGRWAVRRRQPRPAGHRMGAKVVRKIVEAAPDLGIGTLTLYAFSSDNWRRPPREVTGLMRLFRAYLAAETARCVQNGVRLNIIGRRDRIPEALRKSVEASERATRAGRRLLLRIAIDYSAKDSIVEAGRLLGPDEGADRERFAELLAGVMHSLPAPDVDMLIRTGGEQRLSDFLLWECSYAELLFDDCLWPDYSPARLGEAVREFAHRDRRFGAVPQAATA